MKAALLLMLILTACSQSNITGSSVYESQDNANAPVAILPKGTDQPQDRVEVIHFHGTHQCYSCIKVGELAYKTINEYYPSLLESGKISFAHINGELPENRALVEKYGVSSASLWIGTYNQGNFHKEQNVNVWYKIGNEKSYMEYLKEILDKRLAGDLS